ncbi:hypothetical protein GEV43_42460 [Actinomadura sp. J1-007]|nr:hypothetical protein [Actinomadura sp. J1-007]
MVERGPRRNGPVPGGLVSCHGSSGVGTFLLLLWQITGDARYLDHARKAAVAVLEDAPRSYHGACHGLSANGHLLLDLAQALGEDAYARQAEDLATGLAVRSARRAGRHLFGNPLGRRATFGHADGIAGALGFLLRLRHGGPRPSRPSRRRRRRAPSPAAVSRSPHA